MSDSALFLAKVARQLKQKLNDFPISGTMPRWNVRTDARKDFGPSIIIDEDDWTKYVQIGQCLELVEEQGFDQQVDAVVRYLCKITLGAGGSFFSD